MLQLWRAPLCRQVPQEEGAAIKNCLQLSHQLGQPTAGKKSEVVVVGCLEKQAAEWRVLGAPHVVMEWIEHGVELCLQGNPVEDGQSFPLTKSQSKWLDAEIARLLEVGLLKRAAPLLQLYLREAYTLIGQPKSVLVSQGQTYG